MTVTQLFLLATLLASSPLFLLVKFAGAAYLVVLGLRIWIGKTPSTADKRTDTLLSRVGVLRSAFIVTALNPKDIIFFVAFLPQFIDPTTPALPQIIVLELTFAGLVLLSTTAWRSAA